MPEQEITIPTEIALRLLKFLDTAVKVGGLQVAEFALPLALEIRRALKTEVVAEQGE